MRSFFKVSLVGLCVLYGCNGVPPPPDAGAGDAARADASAVDAAVVDAAAVDAPSCVPQYVDAAPRDAFAIDVGATDGGTTDAASGDAGPACSATTCTGAHACLRGVCVATCGADVSGFDAALAAGLVVEGTVCRTPVALEYAGGQMYELMTSTTAPVTTFTLASWTPGTESPTVQMVATAQYTAPDATTMVFAGGYVAVSPDRMHALFGYTTTASGSVGGVFDVATGSGTATDTRADGNFDAAFLDDAHFLINGSLGGAQGVYAGAPAGTMFAQVVSHVGDASGNVALWGAANVVLAGGSSFGTAWPDCATMGDRVLVLDPAALLGATTPIDGSAVVQLSMPSAFELLSGDRAASLHYDAMFAVDAIEVRTLTSPGGVVAVSAPSNLTTGATFTSVTAAGRGMVLAFANGLLFVH